MENIYNFIVVYQWNAYVRGLRADETLLAPGDPIVWQGTANSPGRIPGQNIRSVLRHTNDRSYPFRVLDVSSSIAICKNNNQISMIQPQTVNAV